MQAIQAAEKYDRFPQWEMLEQLVRTEAAHDYDNGEFGALMLELELIDWAYNSLNINSDGVPLGPTWEERSAAFWPHSQMSEPTQHPRATV
jgi:hypothetical protein